MRDFLKSSARYLSVGWFWAVALLVLPNCSFQAGAVGPETNLNPGLSPHDSVILCDIEMARHCASAEEQAMGTRLASAALALNEGKPGTNIGLDDSPDALGRCSGGPEAVIYQGPFPRGYAVCVNCDDVIGPVYADTNAACVAQCEDFFGSTDASGTFIPNVPPLDADRMFCEAHARASTNVPQNGCFAGTCLTAGMVSPDFVDPRQEYEPVVWQNAIGVVPTGAGNSLQRTAAFTGTFDAGAVSSQVITLGDGFVEFTATETNTTRLCGLSSGAPPDTDPSANIGFAITLFNNNGTGDIDLFESGTFIGNFGTFTAGDRFRVRVKDNHNGTAAISYSKVTGPCSPGTTCAETVFYTSLSTGAYPFRVDASLFDQGATLTDARLVRIH